MGPHLMPSANIRKHDEVTIMNPCLMRSGNIATTNSFLKQDSRRLEILTAEIRHLIIHRKFDSTVYTLNLRKHNSEHQVWRQLENASSLQFDIYFLPLLTQEMVYSII